jgi:excisionase family DNA binding protein
MTVAEAARRKGVSRQAIHAAIKAGRLAVVQVGSISLRVTPEALAALELNPNKQLSGRKPRSNGDKRQ